MNVRRAQFESVLPEQSTIVTNVVVCIELLLCLAQFNQLLERGLPCLALTVAFYAFLTERAKPVELDQVAADVFGCMTRRISCVVFV